ncbi:MAG: hypothetical protein OEY23_00505 [Acidimicrobiia bacterium]|nr:hypothetical protein [Acidimicrobiia bacterium]
MAFRRNTMRKRAAVAAASMVAGGLGLTLGTATAGAGTTQKCWGDDVYAELNIELAQVGDVAGIATVGLDPVLDAGSYEVMTIAFDGYIGRAADLERESYFINFLDADGSVITTTGETPELADDLESVEAVATFEVTLDRPAVSMQFVQIIDGVDPGDLVQVGCVGITAMADEEPDPGQTGTTTPTETTNPTEEGSSTEVEPASETTPTTAAPTPTTAAPAPTTTAAPVVTATRSLPVTGPMSLPLALSGVGLVLGGLGLTIRARRLG